LSQMGSDLNVTRSIWIFGELEANSFLRFTKYSCLSVQLSSHLFIFLTKLIMHLVLNSNN